MNLEQATQQALVGAHGQQTFLPYVEAALTMGKATVIARLRGQDADECEKVVDAVKAATYSKSITFEQAVFIVDWIARHGAAGEKFYTHTVWVDCARVQFQ